MAGFSDSNNKLFSLEKVSLPPDFYYSTWRHFQRVITSEISLRPIWQISSHSLTTMENLLSIQEETFTESIVYRDSPVSVPAYQCSWPCPSPLLFVLSPSDPPYLLPSLPDSCHHRTLVAAEISPTANFIFSPLSSVSTTAPRASPLLHGEISVFST